jgi:hypothetical protein
VLLGRVLFFVVFAKKYFGGVYKHLWCSLERVLFFVLFYGSYKAIWYCAHQWKFFILGNLSSMLLLLLFVFCFAWKYLFFHKSL